MAVSWRIKKGCYGLSACFFEFVSLSLSKAMAVTKPAFDKLRLTTKKPRRTMNSQTIYLKKAKKPLRSKTFLKIYFRTGIDC